MDHSEHLTKIAFIENDEIQILKMKQLLQELCLEENLFCFRHPKEALETLACQSVDLILLDYFMPDINGLEFLELLEVPYPNPDIMICSVLEDKECRSRAFERGIVDYILKPYTAEELLSRIRRVLDFRRMEYRLRLLEEAALKDGLTGLWNRKALEEELERISQLSRRYEMNYAVMMIDLDHFKNYNDLYGHLEGDKTLKAAGRIIEKTVRRSDFPGRFGGEEFLVILPYTDETGAEVLGQRLVSLMLEAKILHEKNPPFHVVSFTVGIAVKSGDEPILSVVRKADEALYYGKKCGKKVVHFSELI